MPGSRPTSTRALMRPGQCPGVPSPRPPTESHPLEDANVSFTSCTGTNSPTQDSCDEVALPVNPGVCCAAALVLCQPHPCGDHGRHTPSPLGPGHAVPQMDSSCGDLRFSLGLCFLWLVRPLVPLWLRGRVPGLYICDCCGHTPDPIS
uniref:Uncharacterized protein n=1 Tax=Rhinopithecus bieti TaxID=61621 RepID=A0A2K6MID8_RHIBE